MRLIDADALIKLIEDNICKPCRERKDDYKGVRCRACEYGNEKDDIDSAPTVEERKKGKWIPYDVCSVCGAETEHKIFKEYYCPNCGARMVNEDE